MMMTTMQNNYNNAMTVPHQEHQLDSFGLDGSEDLLFDINEFLNLEGDVT